MECRHEMIMCRDCVKYCLICGKELPNDFGVKEPEKPAEPAEAPKKRTKKPCRTNVHQR